MDGSDDVDDGTGWYLCAPATSAVHLIRFSPVDAVVPIIIIPKALAALI
jgi:hypothetical protein